MTDQELAKRAYACPGWQWMPGIGLDREEVVIDVSEDQLKTGELEYSGRGYAEERVHCRYDFDTPDLNCYICPDFTSPATLGCLHAMVKQATGCAYSWDVSADFLIAALEEAK